jgi:hypothetical protein
MSSKVQLVGGNFQDCTGVVLANGYLTMKLSADEEVNDSLICSGIEIRIQLDANGNVVTSPGQFVWGNDQISPVNSFYKVTGYTVQGQIAFGPNNQQVTGSGGTFDVGSWIPNHVISWVPQVQSLSVQVAGIAFGSQSLLNFVNTGSVIFTDLGNGQISASMSGGGAVTSVFGRTGAVVAVTGDYTVAQITGAAPLASPALTGVPTAPTATVGTNTTQLATTAFVIANAGSSPLLTATVNISSAQILASFTTPVTLLAGIAGKVIIPRQILFNYIHGGTPYAGTAQADVWWTNLTTFNSVSIANISLFMLTQSTNQFFIALTAASGFFWNGNSADIIGQGIVFKAETSNPINGTGSLVVTIEYEVISGVL